MDQTFTIEGSGDNANQCANVQGAANTGNAQTESAFLQYASGIEGFEQENGETGLSVNSESSAECTQEVN
ncbi:MAG: hypothetical protein H0X71_09315 [Rubrobacter sp.]|nr:hypothetical protein [Rubrobacter sp.]